MSKPLLTNPINIQAVKTKDYRRLVKYLKLIDNWETASREELIFHLSFNGFLKRKFKLGWE